MDLPELGRHLAELKANEPGIKFKVLIHTVTGGTIGCPLENLKDLYVSYPTVKMKDFRTTKVDDIMYIEAFEIRR